MLDRNVVARTRRDALSAELQRDGSFLFVLFTDPVGMRAIVRTREELFATTVATRAHSFDVVVNGNYFGATREGKFDALIGHDPIEANATLIEGHVVRAGAPTVGDSRPDRFFLAEVAEPGTRARPGRLRYVTGLGTP